ncbi:MAG: 3-phosphoshikimate 1-carboxyvinyltransferase [Alphaproteobacteria bacterium]|jgi:hypothetical protein|nr:3-phosphoshikimate 1-carboxyvinyltransferase [Alphaproteobacteria bacterium]|tara:strand:- start:51 stop:479 length:429 start_codon:yes stop_codon:yes gene_type:complete
MIMRAMHDPFLERFFSRIPREVAESFDDDQLLAIKRAFADQAGKIHSIDIRLSVPLLLRRYYVVLIAGPERRDRARRRRDRAARPVATAANFLFMLTMVLMVIMAIAGVLYLLKSALGIDLLPDTSLGVWKSVREQFDLMFR